MPRQQGIKKAAKTFEKTKVFSKTQPPLKAQILEETHSRVTLHKTPSKEEIYFTITTKLSFVKIHA